MAGKSLDAVRIRKYVNAIAKGASMNAAAKESQISWATVMRQMKDPYSAICVALADKGLESGGVPGWEKYSPEARRALEDIGYFRERYFARSTSPWAEQAAYKILELAATEREEYVVINIAPGTGKSTFFTHDLPAWLACRNRALSQMIGSSTQNMANNYTGRLRNSFERLIPEKADPYLAKMGLAKDAVSTLARDYGRFKDSSQWTRSQFNIAQIDGAERGEKESSFVAFGMDTGFLGGRFDFVIWDDLVTGKTLKTEDSRNELIRLWEDEAETRLEPNGLLILQGQRLGPNDLYRYCLDLKDITQIDAEGGTDEGRKYHHIKFKAHYEEKCEGLHDKDSPAWPEGCLLDPYRLNWRKLMNAKLNKEEKYLTIYQQEDVDAENSLVQQIWIDGGTDSKNTVFPGCYDETRSAGIITEELALVNGYSVMCVDPSPTKFWAIEWFIFDPETQMKYLVDMERRPMDAPDFLDYDLQDRQFTGLLEEWWLRSKDQGKPITNLIFEENAAQRWLTQFDHFRRWSSLRGVELTKHQTLRNKSDPSYGIQSLGPEYRFGRMRLPGKVDDGSKKRVSQLVKEVTQYPNGSTDDCHPVGTLIQTERGLIPVEDVETGENVLTHLGNWKAVEEVGMRMEDDRVYTVKSAGAMPLQVTGNHPILVVPGHRERPTNKEIFRIDEAQFIRADELSGSKRHSPTPQTLVTPFSTQTVIPTFIDESDTEFALLLGVYLAEGSTSDHAVHFGLNVKERVLADWLIKTMKHRYGCNVNEIIVDNSLSLVFQSVKAKMDFKMYGARTTKALPNEVLTWPVSLQRAILRGWMIGDGCFSRQNFRGTSISSTLLSQMSTFGARLGAPSRLSIHQEPRSGFIMGRAYTSRRQYALSFGHNALAKILDPTSHLDIDRWGNFNLKDGKNMGMWANPEEGYVLRKLKSVESRPYKDVVYSLQVADDRSYVAEGVAVHNCVMANWFLIWNAPTLFPPMRTSSYQLARPSWVMNGVA